MAQTKRKRRTKHRGNAAGIVESRGRTGRVSTSAERSSDKSGKPRNRGLDRLDREPTWRSAANRAVIATLVFFGAVVLLFKQPISASISLAAFMLVLYIPMGYYTDLTLYRRRQRKKQLGSKATDKP